MLGQRDHRTSGLIGIDRLDLNLSYAAHVVLTPLPQPPKRNSNLIRIDRPARQLEVRIGSRNDVVILRQFWRSTDSNFVRKACPSAIEAWALGQRWQDA